MKMQLSLKKKFAVLLAVVAGMLLLSMSPAYAWTPASQTPIKAGLNSSIVPADVEDDQQVFRCLFMTALVAFSEYATCRDDDACKAQVIYFNMLDAIMCIRPDAENIELLSCASDAILSFIAQGASCGKDNYLCNLLNLIALVRGLSDCFDMEEPETAVR